MFRCWSHTFDEQCYKYGVSFIFLFFQPHNHLSFMQFLFFFKRFFLMWTTFQVFIELVTILPLFYAFLFFWPHAMEDLSSQIRDQTHDPSIGREVLTTGLPGKFLNSFLEQKQISLRNLTTESICPLVSCNLLFCSIAMYIQVHKKHMFTVVL